jgi:hypothetical protein
VNDKDNGALASGTSGWTVESVLIHLNGALSDQKDRFAETLSEVKARFKDALEAQEKKNQQQFADADKAVRAAMAAAEKAVEKAEQNAEKWRANANEWRAAMSDRERNFATVQRVDSLEKTQDAQKTDITVLAAGEVEARTLLRSDLNKEIAGLRESRSEGSGEKQSQFYGREHNKWIVSMVVTIFTSAVVVLLVQLLRK